MDTKQFNIEAGDILIVKGKALMSKLLVLAQKPFYFNNTASHILSQEKATTLSKV